MRYRLRTLVIATAVGPVLLALAWYLGIWFWKRLPELLATWGQFLELQLTWGQFLALLAIVCSAVLSIYALVAPPADAKVVDRAARWGALIIATCEFFALWTGLWALFGLLAWMFVWGDNQGQRESDLVWCVAGLVAAFLAANVGVRGMMGLATRRYLLVNAVLTGAILILVAPHYLRQWLR